MGIFSWLFGQFIDVIEWKDDSQNTIVWRYPRGDSEIKYGAKLIVRESQVAVFVDQGKIADILGPGTYELETKNLPILTDLQHWDHGFESPFKADIYFINTKIFNLKWGTKNPIILKDELFSIVRLRAFGAYEFKVDDPAKFLKEIVGTDGHFRTEEIEERLSNIINSNLAIVLGKRDISILDLAANYDNFANFMQEKLQDEFARYGLQLIKIIVENISLPKEVEEAIDKRSAREAVGNLDEHLKYESAQALENSQTFGELSSIATGVAMANEITKTLKQKQSPTPPPLPTNIPKNIFIVKNGKALGPFTFEKIKEMIQNGTIHQNSFIWYEGLNNWQRAKDVLKELFIPTTPPPIPNEE